MAYYTKPRKPSNAGPGWYKAFADGIQDHYNKDYIEVNAVYYIYLIGYIYLLSYTNNARPRSALCVLLQADSIKMHAAVYTTVAYVLLHTYQVVSKESEDASESSDEEEEEDPNDTEELPELPSGQFYVDRLVAKRVKV